VFIHVGGGTIYSEAFGLCCPDFADIFVRGQTFESLEAFGKVVGRQERVLSRLHAARGVPEHESRAPCTLLQGDGEARAADDQSKFQFIHEFYEEYFAVMGLPAEFYLETVKLVFQDHALPLGKLKVHGRQSIRAPYEPDRLFNNLGREAVAAIADLDHHLWLRLKSLTDKLTGDVTKPLRQYCRSLVETDQTGELEFKCAATHLEHMRCLL
jgi:hypothetical protein